MATPFPATYSTPSAYAIREEVLPGYPIGRCTECRLHMSGVNDVYLVRTPSDRYVFKAYRTGWRSKAEVLYELELLAHLDQKGVAVALPLRRADGEWIAEIPAPEGTRQGVLFQYAPGQPPAWPFHQSKAESRLMGRALAAIHDAAESFRSSQPRFRYDEALFLNESLAAARPFLAHRGDDWEYLVGLAERLRARLGELAAWGMGWSVCHGDYHGGNLFIVEDQTVTAFDFDVCGAGWSAYDLARWREDTEGKAEDSWEAFLQGYEERRPLSPAEREAVPVFVMLRMLHWMQVKCGFVACEAWDCWDIEFFLNDTLTSFKAREGEAGLLPGC